jgi:DNA modification methylase
MNNTLYYSDNLDVLGRYIKDESVDLIYLDPCRNFHSDPIILPAYRLSLEDQRGHHET